MTSNKTQSELGSKNEKIVENEKRSLMELASCLGIISTVRSLKSIPKTLVAGVRLGRLFDDIFDEGLNRRSLLDAVRASEKQVKVDFRYLVRYQKGWGKLTNCVYAEIKSKDEQVRVLENSRNFVNNVAIIENFVCSRPQKDWDLTFVKEYRESICFLWAIYFVSISPDSKINMLAIDPNFEPGRVREVFSKYLENFDTEKAKVEKLYSGALVYQIIGDRLSSRDKQNFIPGFGSITGVDAADLDVLQKQYIKSAKDNGMTLLEELGIVYLFPKMRYFLNKINEKH